LIFAYWVKIEKLKRRVVELEKNTIAGHCKDCANYQKDKCYCMALMAYLIPEDGYCYMFMKEENKNDA
jgi:hypothetical protein